MKPIFTFLSVGAVALILLVPAQLSVANDQPSSAKCAVYAKTILPMKPPRDGSHPIVESWISKNLHKRGKSELRAVTQWVRLAKKGETVTRVWNATIDGKGWGCPVVGRIVERTKDGKVRVELTGWSPVGAEIKGQTLAADIGNRRIAVVDTGEGDDSGIAYVALCVGPASATPHTRQK